MKQVIKYLSVLVIGILGGVLGAVMVLNFPLIPNQTSPKSNSEMTMVTTNNQTTTTEAVKVIQHAVVSVINYQPASSSSSLDEFYSHIFGSDTIQTLPKNGTDDLVVAGEGSGVIYKKANGYAYLVTNNHVVENASKLEILMSNGNKVVGELVGSDVYSDLAVIKISDDGIDTVGQFADSSSLNVGEPAIAIGSPLGSAYANSVTEGIVSSLSRVVTSTNDLGQTISTNAIQTDAAINPGNSGGPLINSQGQIIGINSSKIAVTNSPTHKVAVEGMGFAIPSNDVVSIIQQLEDKGAVERPALGITMANLSSLSTSARQALELPDHVTNGIVVLSTQEGMPAFHQLENYDVITEIQGQTVSNTSDLQSILYKHAIGDTIKVTIYRRQEQKELTLHLDKSTLDLAVN